ncbi:MAG: glycosyltransferase family 39 protein [Streptosporangiaceae bacterium]
MDRPPNTAPPAARPQPQRPPQQRQQEPPPKPIPPSLMTLDRIRLGRGPRKPGYVVPKPAESGWSSAPSRRRDLISLCSLLALLAVQTCLTLRLHNGASLDEALLITGGRAQLDGLPWTGTPLSGAPQIYPALAAVLDGAGGIELVRSSSLLLMLAATSLFYFLNRRLFNERASLCATSLLVVTQSTALIGNLATFDALAFFLLTLSLWIVVMTGKDHIWLGVAAAPVLGLAVAVKFAAAPYVFVVAAIAALVSIPYIGRAQGMARGGALLAGALASVGLLLLATGSFEAFQEVTTAAAPGGPDSPGRMLGSFLEWGGLVLAVGILGGVFYVRRSRMGEVTVRPGAAPDPGRNWRIGLATVMCGAALIAPLYQAFLHNGTSLAKNVGFGLLFTTSMAGVGVTRMMGAHFKFPQAGILIGVLVMVFGMAQASWNFGYWSNQKVLVEQLEPYFKSQGHYLSDAPEIASYYAGENSDPGQWIGLNKISYRSQTGAAGYQKAIKDGYFDVVVLDRQADTPLRKLLLTALDTSDAYRPKASLAYTSALGPSFFEVWIKR